MFTKRDFFLTVAVIAATILVLFNLGVIQASGAGIFTALLVFIIGMVSFIGIAASMPRLVDIWLLQSKLMEISDQRQPTRPLLTKGSILYSALTAEELGETILAMAMVLKSQPLLTRSYPGWSHLEGVLLQTASQLNSSSKLIRSVLESCQERVFELTREQAEELFDGATDVAVTTAGITLSSGLPGAAGYLDVQLSNHSKANPKTGKIDKDPSGKWIKGPHYRPPNLGRILDMYSARDSELLET